MRTAIVVVGGGGSTFLKKTLESAKKFSVPLVYVDMATVDDSTDVAHRLKVPVVELAIDRPISRARACNKGATYVVKKYPEVEFIQFVRVGCYLDPSWMASLEATFDKHPRVGAISGLSYSKKAKGKEFVLFSEAVRGFLGDLNGGDFAVSLRILKIIKGFDAQPRLGFETEYIVRMQSEGFYSQRLPCRMLDVDPLLLSFIQSIKTSYRQGYIQYYLLFKAPLLKQRVVFFLRSFWVTFWALWLPILIVYCVTQLGPQYLQMLLLYGGLWFGFLVRRRILIEKFEPWSRSMLQATRAVFGFWSKLLGHFKSFSDLSTEETAKIFSKKKRKMRRIPV